MYLNTNQASSVLVSAIAPSTVSFTIGFGDGLHFPEVSHLSGDIFACAIEDTFGNYEIVTCYERDDDTFTVNRAQEGTVAQSFDPGAKVELRLTAEQLRRLSFGPHLYPLNGDRAMGLYFDDAQYRWVIAGERITTESRVLEWLRYLIPAGMIQLWSGSAASIPAGWHLCDGTNGTPNLRDRFVIGAGNAYVAGAAGGSTDIGGGDHNHGGKTGGTALSLSQMPKHDHGLESQEQLQGGAHWEYILNWNGHSWARTGPAGGNASGATDPHDHTIGAGSHTHSAALPPYYALCYIMKLPY